MNLRPFLLSLVLSISSTGISTHVTAGGSAVMEAGIGANVARTSIEFNDGNMRMSAAIPGMDGYMVMTDTGIYMVTGWGGMPMVLDLGAAMSMSGGMIGDMMGGQGMSLNQGIGQVSSIEDAGRDETVAGIVGRVYQLSYVDPQGNSQSNEIVLGRHPVLRELSNTMATWARMMAAYMSVDVDSYQDSMDTLLQYGDGILRVGSVYRLVSLDDNAPAATRFVLPAAPQQIPRMW